MPGPRATRWSAFFPRQVRWTDDLTALLREERYDELRKAFEALAEGSLAAAAPRGSDADLRTALSMLELPKGQNDEIRTARRCVEALALNYRTDQEIEASAPRVTDVRARLLSIEKMARDLANALSDADDYTLESLVGDEPMHEAMGIEVIEGPEDDLLPLRQEAVARELPFWAWGPSVTPNGPHRPKEPSWIRRLYGLANLAKAAREKYEPKSARGRGNLYQKAAGAKRQLVDGCWSIFNEFRPWEATASDDGPFILFIKAVHDFAMGGDPPAPSTFERLAKEELRRRRRMRG